MELFHTRMYMFVKYTRFAMHNAHPDKLSLNKNA